METWAELNKVISEIDEKPRLEDFPRYQLGRELIHFEEVCYMCEQPVYSRLLDSLELLTDCLNYIDGKTNDGIFDFALFSDFATLAEQADEFIKQQKDLPLHRCHEMFENMNYYTEINLNAEHEPDSVEIFREYTKPIAELWIKNVATAVEDKADKVRRSSLYPPLTKLERSEIDGTEYPCRASVIVIGYNHLDYTKQCVESILKHTNDVGGYELVLVNNGSADGTQEYFESIENAKVTYLPANCGATAGMSVGMALSHGKYLAVCPNDMVLTPRWLSNLLTCVESNPSYGFVSPVSNNMANYQMIDVSFADMDEMQAFAEGYNNFNPKKWEERQFLLPNIMCAPRKLAAHVGYYDPRYYYGEYADFDFSFIIRRAGYKLISCGDTFVYHHGHITTDAEHKKNNSLQISFKIFDGRWGVDDVRDFIQDENLVATVDISGWHGSRNLLAVNAKYGCTPQMVANKFRSKANGQCDIYAWSDNRKYEADLKSVAASVTGPWEKTFYGTYMKESMDCVLIHELPFINSGGLLNFFYELRKILKVNGQLVIAAKNPIKYDVLEQMLYDMDVPATAVINTSYIINLLQKAGFHNINLISETNGNPISQDISQWKTVFPLVDHDALTRIFTVDQFFFSADIITMRSV